ncbi:unnamed protein product, partial [marine sediment metagenome]
DSDLVSNIMSDEFMDLVEDSGIEWYILPGNHDETGNNWKLSKATSLAHMFRRCKLINWLTKEKFKDLIVYGYEYYHNIEGYIRENGLYCEDKTDKLKIAIVHALITLKPLPYECMHVVAKDIKTDFDVVLVAHNHSQRGIKEINGVKFVFLGALGRRKIDEKDIKPSALLINTETKELKIIELKSAKKAEEVFDLAKVAEATKTKTKLGFEKIVTYALRYIYNSDYSFELEFGRQGNLSKLDFNVKTPDCKEPLDLLDSQAGGVLDVVSVALRIALLELIRPKVE